MMTLARTLRSMGHNVSFIGFQGREFADYARREGIGELFGIVLRENTGMLPGATKERLKTFPEFKYAAR